MPSHRTGTQDGSRLSEIGRQKTPTDGRQFRRTPTNDDRKTPTESRKTHLEDRKSPLVERHSPSDLRRTPVNERRSPSDHRRTPADDYKSLVDRRTPVDRWSPSKDRRTPTEHRKTPLDDRMSPLVGRKTPIDNKRSPQLSDHRKTPSDHRKTPIENRKSPFDNHSRPKENLGSRKNSVLDFLTESSKPAARSDSEDEDRTNIRHLSKGRGTISSDRKSPLLNKASAANSYTEKQPNQRIDRERKSPKSQQSTLQRNLTPDKVYPIVMHTLKCPIKKIQL